MKPAGLPSQSQSLRRRARRGRGAPARGFIMGYIVLALLVFGILTAAMGRLKDTQATALWVDNAQAALRANIQTIRARMLVCAANMYADPDPTKPSAQPMLDALPSSGTSPEGVPLEELPCTGTTNSIFPQNGPSPAASAEGMFDGSGAVFKPTPPRGFEPWRYVNQVKAGAAKGAIFVRTSTADPNAIAAVNRIVKSFRSPEVVSTVEGGRTVLTFYLRLPASEAT